MTKIIGAFGIIATVLLVLSSPDAARAQGTVSWVSGKGDDSNICSRAQPCATLSQAYSQTAAGGEIDILDGAAFGGVSISHAITIVSAGAGVASVTFVSLATLPTDEVILRGLNFVPYTNGPFAVQDTGAGSLVIDHCTFHEYQGAFAIGLQSAGVAKLRVVDTVVSNSGNSADAAIFLQSLAGGSVTAQFERVQIINSVGNAIRADSTASGAGPVYAELHDVTVDGSNGGSGIAAVSPTSGGAKATIMADNVTAVNNAGFGLRAVGGTASVFLRRSTIANNNRGIGVSSGGAIVSYGDNSFADNVGGDGAPTSTLALK